MPRSLSFKRSTDQFRSQVQFHFPFNESNGATSVTDYSNNVLSPSFVGNAIVSNGQQNFSANSLALDGNGDRLTIAPNANTYLNVSTPFSFQAWIRIATTGINHGIVAQYQNPSYNFDWYVGTTGFLVGELYNDANAYDSFISTLNVPVGVWTHVVFAYDGSKFYLGVNGTVQSQNRTLSSFSNRTTNTLIGALILSGGNPGFQFNGNIQDLMFTRGANGARNFTANYKVPYRPLPRR